MKKLALFAMVFAAAAMISGCDPGVAPAGMSKDDAKNAYDKMSPEEQIRFIAGSPLPGPEKEKRYAEIEAKTGVKASEVLGQQQQQPGAGAANVTPATGN